MISHLFRASNYVYSVAALSYRAGQNYIFCRAVEAAPLGALPPNPRKKNYYERTDAMSKKETGMYFKCNQKQREQIKKNAKACGLKQGDYLLQRALGFEPKVLNLGAYLNLYKKLCDVANKELSAETETRLLDVLDQIYSRLFEGTPPSEETLREEKQALTDYFADVEVD